MYFLTQFIHKLAGEGSFNVVNEAVFTSYVLASKEKSLLNSNSVFSQTHNIGHMSTSDSHIFAAAFFYSYPMMLVGVKLNVSGNDRL